MSIIYLSPRADLLHCKARVNILISWYSLPSLLSAVKELLAARHSIKYISQIDALRKLSIQLSISNHKSHQPKASSYHMTCKCHGFSYRPTLSKLVYETHGSAYPLEVNDPKHKLLLL